MNRARKERRSSRDVEGRLACTLRAAAVGGSEGVDVHRLTHPSVDLQPECFDDGCPQSDVGRQGLPEFLGTRVESGLNARVDQ